MADENNSDEQQFRHPGGRPLKFESVEALDAAIDAYLGDCAPHIAKRQVQVRKADGTSYWAEEDHITDQKPVTVSGAAFALNSSRRTLLSYKDRPEFLPSIERLLAATESYAESMLFGPGANGAKFVLTNNYNGKFEPWSDKRSIDHTSDHKPIPLLAGLAPIGPLEIEDELDDGATPADDSADEDQSS